MRASCALCAMPKFRYGDRREVELFVRLRVQPGIQIEEAPFCLNYDIGINQDCHLSTCGGRVFRAFSMSWRKAVASSSPRWTSFSPSRSAAAISRPVLGFLVSGIDRKSV